MFISSLCASTEMGIFRTDWLLLGQIFRPHHSQPSSVWPLPDEAGLHFPESLASTAENVQDKYSTTLESARQGKAVLDMI